MSDMEHKFDTWCHIDDSVSYLNASQEALKLENRKLQESVHIQNRVNELENSTKGNNLIFSGIKVANNIPVIDSVRSCLADNLNIGKAKELLISDAFKMKDGRILVKFGLTQDRNMILGATKKCDPQEIHVKPDICKAWHKARKKLAPVYKKAMSEGHTVKVRRDSLLVDGMKYTYNAERDEIVSERLNDKRTVK
jgi:hypothetical protein